MSTYAVVLSMVGSVMAFAPVTPYSSRVSAVTALNVATDPNTVSKKQYQDICGVSFGEDEMVSRLQQTSYLYPKHVEVIEDLAPIADEMTDKIVSTEVMFMYACVSLIVSRVLRSTSWLKRLLLEGMCLLSITSRLLVLVVQKTSLRMVESYCHGGDVKNINLPTSSSCTARN